MNYKYLRWGGLLGLLGVVIVTAGEFLMLYSPDGGYGLTAGHQNFLHPSIERLQIGFYLAVLFVPVYILIYDHIARMLKAPDKLRWVIIALAVTGFTTANVWLGTNAYIGYVVHQIALGLPLQETLEFLHHLSDPLLQVIRFVVLMLSGIIIWQIWKKDTYYPHWVIVFAPFFTIVYIFILFFTVPVIGGLLLPAALNFAHVLFMAISSYYAFNITSAE